MVLSNWSANNAGAKDLGRDSEFCLVPLRQHAETVTSAMLSWTKKNMEGLRRIYMAQLEQMSRFRRMLRAHAQPGSIVCFGK
jgi:hypothetical protein